MSDDVNRPNTQVGTWWHKSNSCTSKQGLDITNALLYLLLLSSHVKNHISSNELALGNSRCLRSVTVSAIRGVLTYNLGVPRVTKSTSNSLLSGSTIKVKTQLCLPYSIGVIRTRS